MKLRILDASVAADRAVWLDVHARWEHREVFAHPAYVELFARTGDHALAALGDDEHGTVLYPFLSRPIEGGRDLTSPYGYGGPFVVGRPAAAPFWAAFDAWARGAGVVSEFIRFSLFEDELLSYPGDKVVKLTNVVCELAQDEQQIWEGFEHKVRKNVNRARREGVTIELDPDGSHLNDFLGIYTSTMDRREAKRGFYFPREFFETIVRELPGQFMFLHARHADRIISTELALASATHVYSFLGGTEEAAFDLRPNDLLKLELIHWAKRTGRSQFVLGGGYAPDDGIFRYKRAFAPGGLKPYVVGTRVLDPDRYAALVAAHEARGRDLQPTWIRDPGFFPAYRADLPT
jgi:GNAT acetyltransferase-like protein